MDSDSGRLYEGKVPQQLYEQEGYNPQRVVGYFEIGERVEVKGCWFEVTAVKTRERQRLHLKPIPRPANPQAALESLARQVQSATPPVVMNVGDVQRALESHKQIEELGAFILANVPGEPSQSEGAVECVMRVITSLQNELASARLK